MERNSDDDESPSGGVFGGIDGTAGIGDRGEPVDVHEYDDRITVVADVPGVARDDIALECDGRNLAIHVAREPRPSRKRVDLPAYVDDGSMETSFNNGVLEITLDRDTDPANIGFQ